MHISEFIESICAVHLSSRVESPFLDRGGLMIVGPPGSLKSTASLVLEVYPDTSSLSDINHKQLVVLREAMASQQIRTLILPELAKIYQRNDATAANVEGTLQALVSEGFSQAAYEDSRVPAARARVTVIAAMTIATRARRFQAWEEGGFNRRFLWPLIHLDDATALEEAVYSWRRLSFSVPELPRALGAETIPNQTTEAERRAMGLLVKHQPGGSHGLHVQLLAKMLAVLRWWYQGARIDRDPMVTLRRFAESLGPEGAGLDLREIGATEPRTKPRAPVVRVTPHVAAQTLGRERWRKVRQQRTRPRRKK